MMTVYLLLIVMAVQMLAVACYMLRLIFTMRGRKYTASMISLLEMTAYIYSVDLVLSRIDYFWGILAYAAGYAAGILLGSWIESKIALGYVLLKVVLEERLDKINALLSHYSSNVAIWNGTGMRGDKQVLSAVIRRKHVPVVQQSLFQLAPQAFISILEVRSHGQYRNKHHISGRRPGMKIP